MSDIFNEVDEEVRREQLKKLWDKYGLFVIALAFLVERLGTLLEATNKVISLVGGPLIGLFLLGMMFSRANARGALAGWAAGFVATLWFAFGTKISFLWWAAFGAAVTVGVGLAASLLGARPADHQINGLSWSRRPPAEG